MNNFDFETAANIYTGKGFVDEKVLEHQESECSPEKNINLLSGEARSIILLILNSPKEMLGIFTPGGKVKKNANSIIRKFMIQKIGRVKTMKAMDEIKEYLGG